MPNDQKRRRADVKVRKPTEEDSYRNGLWVVGERGDDILSCTCNDLADDPLSPFWVEWSKKRKRELAIDVKPGAMAFHLARVEAHARQQVERHAGRVAALTAAYGHEFSHGSICAWICVNDGAVPEDLRGECEQHLYGHVEGENSVRMGG